MRMWMINIKYMCNYHIIKEHNDIHRFLKKIESGNFDLIKYNFPVVNLEPEAIRSRHDILMREMIKRHIPHIEKIKLVNLRPYSSYQLKVKANLWYNVRELCRICKNCRKRILKKT